MRISDWSSDVCSSDLGALQQGLRDLAAWVEKGVRPSSTQYRVDDAQVVLPDKAARRGGIQPVIPLQANGGVRADVAVGAPVPLGARIDVPPNAGRVVPSAWDSEAPGSYPHRPPAPTLHPAHVPAPSTPEKTRPN